MPRLSDTMDEGTVARWLKAEGESVARGDELAEIETDKVTVTVDAEDDGFLLAIYVAAGASAPPGATLAVIGSSPTEELPARGAPPVQDHIVERTADPPQPQDERVGDDYPREHIRATPLARKLARESGLALSGLGPGSGPNGRILRRDVERAASSKPVVVPSALGSPVPVGNVQRATARRLLESKREIPHYYVDTDVDMTSLLRLRAEIATANPDSPVSVIVFVARAVALALEDVPEVNASWQPDASVVRRGQADIGLAVALEDDWVVVPVVRDVGSKSLLALNSEVAELAGRARAGGLAPDEMGHGSFTVSSLGSDGVDSFHAIINPPESGILAVGTIAKKPFVVEGELAVRDIARFSLSADHRVYSGRTAARFLGTIRRRLEEPLSLCI